MGRSLVSIDAPQHHVLSTWGIHPRGVALLTSSKRSLSHSLSLLLIIAVYRVLQLCGLQKCAERSSWGMQYHVLQL